MRRRRTSLVAGTALVLAAALAGCSSADGAATGTSAPAAGTMTYTVPPITVVSTAPAETITESETVTVTTGPPPTTVTKTVTEAEPEPFDDESSADLTWWNCDRLVKQAAQTSEQTNQQPVLLKVRGPEVVEDNRKTVTPPDGANTSIVLSCKGVGAFSSGPERQVTVTLSIDADSDLMISYRSQSF